MIPSRQRAEQKQNSNHWPPTSSRSNSCRLAFLFVITFPTCPTKQSHRKQWNKEVTSGSKIIAALCYIDVYKYQCCHTNSWNCRQISLLNVLTLSVFIKIAVLSTMETVWFIQSWTVVLTTSRMTLFSYLLSAGILTHDGGEDEDPNQVADDDKDIPITWSKRTWEQSRGVRPHL